MEKVIIPKNATNGDMIKAMLNPYKICEYEYNVHIYMTEEDFWKAEYQINCDTSWWNMPYNMENGLYLDCNADSKECEDVISRKAVEKITWEEPSYTDALNALTEIREKVRALPPVMPQPKEKEFAKFNDFYPEDRATYPPAETEILIKNHNGNNFIAYLNYDDGEDGGWGFYSENGDFIADVNEIDAWMLIPQHERDKNYIPVQEREVNVLTSHIDDPGTDEEEEIWQI